MEGRQSDRRARRVTRRTFVGGATAAAAAGWMIVPRHVLGAGASNGQTPPSERVHLAAVGVGGQGGSDLNSMAACGAQIIALADVDQKQGEPSFKRFAEAKRFHDFREMLEVVDKQIDAVQVSTPDHFHSVATMAAIKRGKHVYCEKPLAHSVWEVRELMRAAAERNVVTQLGNQGHSFDDIRTFCEMVWDGAIGNVHTVHAGCGSVYSKIDDLPRLAEKHEVPATLDWDLWLGPAAERPYHPMYLPGQWRGWMPFGTGVIGDWTCHVVDPVFWALDLVAPATIRAKADGYDPQKHADTFPKGTVIRYEFPAKGDRGPVTLYWYDGVERMPAVEGLVRPQNLPMTGAIVVGDQGGITYGSHGAGGPRLFPEAKAKAYRKPPQKLPRIEGRDQGLHHHRDFLAAVKRGNGARAGSDFAYGGPLTEIALVGVIATRLLGQELKWDAPNMRFTNSEAANRLLKPTFRAGWGW